METQKTEGDGGLSSSLSGIGYQRKQRGDFGAPEGLELNLAYLAKSCTLKEVYTREYTSFFVLQEENTSTEKRV